MIDTINEFGDYVDLEPVSSGTFGVVYKGWHRQLDRWDAVKIIRDDMLRDDGVEAFLQEARLAAAVHLAGSPFVACVYNSGLVENRAFIATEFVEGQTLEQWLMDLRCEDRAPPIEDAVRIVEGIARGLAHAHARQIAHHDIKPANIMLRHATMAPVIVDFGIGATLGEAAKFSGDESLPGTPRYMAPEQALGTARRFSPESDVYSLGLVMYELLTGQPAFASHPLQAAGLHGSSDRDESDSALRRHYSTIPPGLRFLRPEVPAALDRLCLRCLEPNIRKRTITAHDIVERLKSFRTWARFRARCRIAWPWAACLVVLAVLCAALLRQFTPGRSEFGELKFLDGFESVAISDTIWETRLPHVTKFVGPDLSAPEVRLEEGKAIFANRGYLVSKAKFPAGVSIKLKWMYLDGRGTYCDHLVIGLRTTGNFNPQWPHELQDGITVRFVPAAQLICVENNGIPVEGSSVMRMERYSWHDLKVIDNGRTIAVFFDDMEHPKIELAVPDSSQFHHVAIYNREAVGHVNKISVIDDVEIRAPSRLPANF